MSLTSSQQHTLLALLAQLQPHWRRDRALPARIQLLLARDRRFGSRDRRLYRELLYTAIRYLPWIETELTRDPAWAVGVIAWLAADTPATKRFRDETLSEWPPCPPTLAERSALLATLRDRLSRQGAAGSAPFSTPVEPKLPALSPPQTALETESLATPAPAIPQSRTTFDPETLLPGWFREHAPEVFAPDQLDALLSRAPLWLRVRPDSADRVTAEFDQLGWRWAAAVALPSAIQVFDEVDVITTVAYQQGLIEVQDLGSQLLLEAAGIAPGGHWLDACAGAGGKTLQLAALLGSGGRIDACDVRAAALDELALRARRAGLAIDRPGSRRNEKATRPSAAANVADASVRIMPAADSSHYDGVLVDAPCSGSGTWRRAPHLKWTTTPVHIERAASVQREVLDRFSRQVRPGGRLIYATCSLSQHENEQVVAAFLGSHPEFLAAPPARDFGGVIRGGGLTLLPARHNTDGFFVACLHRALSATP